MRHIHTSIVSRHLATRGNNKILRTPPPHTSSSEEILPRLTRRTLAQLRTNKSPFLKSYLHKVDAKTHPSPLCPLCNIHTHDTHHLFNCTHIRTTLSPLDLWTDPAGVTALLARWTEKLAGGPQAGTSDSPYQQGSWEWVDNNNITINKRFRNSILQVKGYPGADGGSDHVPIVATLRMKLRMLKQKKAGDKLETQLLRTDDTYREQYQQRIANQLNGIDAIDQLEDRYDRFVSILTTSAQETLPKVYVKPKQKWMTKISQIKWTQEGRPNQILMYTNNQTRKSKANVMQQRRECLLNNAI